MPYVAVKGGEQAIRNAEALLKAKRRGDETVPELSVEQIKQQMQLAVNRVMAEGSLYDPDLAALAIKQAWGDLVEAAFLLRAYRTTLPRLYYSEPLDTSTMAIQRRISAIFKEAPGGQKLGPTFDYIHRLLDFKLAAEDNTFSAPTSEQVDVEETTPRVAHTLAQEGLVMPPGKGTVGNRSGIEENQSRERDIAHPTGHGCDQQSDNAPFDITRQSLTTPTHRDARLQNLARGDEGIFVVYGLFHPARVWQKSSLCW